MVIKQCSDCGRYFGGDLNGNYACPDCARQGLPGLRPLTSLDGLDFGEDLKTARKVPASQAPDSAKGQAA